MYRKEICRTRKLYTRHLKNKGKLITNFAPFVMTIFGRMQESQRNSRSLVMNGDI